MIQFIKNSRSQINLCKRKQVGGCLKKEIERWMDYKETLGNCRECDGNVCCLDYGDHFMVHTYVKSHQIVHLLYLIYLNKAIQKVFL